MRALLLLSICLLLAPCQAQMLINPYRFAAAPASGPPTFVAGANSNGTNIPVPSGTLSGHLMVAFVGSETPGSISTPSGWTQRGSTFTWGGGLGYGAGLFTRVASGSEPANYQFCNSTYRFGFILTYSGASQIDVAGSIVDLSGTSMTLTGITSSSGSTLLALIHDRDPGVTFTPPSGMTERLDATSASYWQVSGCDLSNADSSNRTFTVASSTWPAVGVLVSIKP